MNDSTSLLEHTAPLEEEVIPPAAESFYMRQVLKAFSFMQAGYLRLTLPDGTVRTFGSAAGAVQATLRVRSEAFFKKCVLFGDVGFGESYVDGDWETDSIERVISWALLNVQSIPGASGSLIRSFALNLLKVSNQVQHWLRPNSLHNCRRNIAEHYDLGNSFYRLWLDPTMTYSSALFTEREQSLESAQFAKYDRLCRKLQLQPGDHVLEIGCGWGGFGEHAARHYGCRVTGLTISQAQHDFAVERMERAGLSSRVTILLQDYRKISGTFDKIVSIEMMEALGDRYLGQFCQQLHRLLKPHGFAALHYITIPDSRHAELRRGVDFIQKHIFPGSLLLSIGRVSEALSQAGDLFLHDLLDMGSSYARTLRCWRTTFVEQQEAVTALGFDARFQRKWDYYLQYCEAAFARRNISVVQAIYTRPNNPVLTDTFLGTA